MNPDRYEQLVVRYVDDVATPAEREELMAWVADKPDLRAELEEHLALRAVTDGWVARLRLDEAEDRFTASRGARLERSVGWTLVLLATGLLFGGGMVEIALDPEAPLWLQLGLGGLLGGTLVLLLSVIRWRIRTQPHDRYTEIVR